MDLEKFYEKAWSKQKVTQLREYISYAIKEINERQFNKDDVISEVYLDDIRENITGITKQGLLSARTIGKTKKEILYEARKLHDFLQWDYTSIETQDIFEEKYRRAWQSYNDKPGNVYLTQDQYQTFVELIFAFKDKTAGFSSDQIKEYFDEVNSEDNDYTMKDLISALAKASKEKGLDETTRTNRVYQYLRGEIE
ncbi:MAG: hypothetical protein J6T10_06240 [Methanobrevibacter sp.]|nr:hypothetical protein [Methanobrevibacter sp.]